MKNKLMERKFFDSVIHQRIDNEMLSVTDLSNLYDKIKLENNWPDKPLHRFFDKEKHGNTEYIIELVKEGKLVKDRFSTFMEVLEKQGLLKALKQFGLYVMIGKGENRAVYCHPYIFVAIAMWMNPTFKAKATIWIADELILNRIEAGERYSILCSSISDYILPNLTDDKDKQYIYSNFAILINKLVFGKHSTNLRQTASREDLIKLRRLQDKLSTLIEFGIIKNYNDALKNIDRLKL